MNLVIDLAVAVADCKIPDPDRTMRVFAEIARCEMFAVALVG